MRRLIWASIALAAAAIPAGAEHRYDRKLEQVQKWVEGVCPVTKQRVKLLQVMEERDRRDKAHVLSSAASSVRQRLDPMRNFAKRKQIQWIRVDPDA